MHGAHSNGVVMRRPDGSPMTREEVIVRRRGALKWLPVLCSNDLVHGSWYEFIPNTFWLSFEFFPHFRWFAIGSFFMAIFGIYPLVHNSLGLYDSTDDLMPASDFTITWVMVIISGIFFTLGSAAFVHGFEEPPRRAIFYNYKHLQTDELLASWMFLWGVVPGIPYMLVFFAVDPSPIYFFGLIGAVVFVLASALSVASCYPSDKVRK